MVTGSTPSSQCRRGCCVDLPGAVAEDRAFSNGQTGLLTAALPSITRVVPLQAFFDLVKFLLGKPYPKSKESCSHGTDHSPQLP
jgi:hypothetical protein